MAEYIDYLNYYPVYGEVVDRDKQFVTAIGVQQSEKVYFTYLLANHLKGKRLLYVASDYVNAQSVVRQLCALGINAVYLPYRDEVLLHRRSVSNAHINALSYALYRIASGCEVVVACVESLCYTLPDKDKFTKSIFSLTVNHKITIEKVISYLVACGYVRQDEASQIGDFCLRGDILDIFTPQYDTPVRISFFYDEVESIKLTGSNKVSLTSLDRVTVFPFADTVCQTYVDYARREAFSERLDSNGRARINTIIDEIATCRFSHWLSCYGTKGNLFDYTGDCTVLWDEPKLISQRIDKINTDFETRFPELLKAGEVLPSHKKLLRNKQDTIDLYMSCKQIALQQMSYTNTFFRPQKIVSFTTSPLFNYQYNASQLKSDFLQWRTNGYTVLLYGCDKAQSASLQERMSLLDLSVRVGDNSAYNLNDALILPYDFEKGYISHSNKLVIVGAKDVGKRQKTPVVDSNSPHAISFSAGDYVVHELHGIGLCQGLTTLGGDNGKDYILVSYRNGDKLYVPVEASNLLSRFSGSDKAPALSVIGGADFERTKSKVKSNIKQMSFDLLKLYAERENKRGYVYSLDSYLCSAFAESFPYVETPDQLTSIAQIDGDLTKDAIMDRLLVGDVGYGKTEVALRTAFKVISNGYQVAMLAPTTILSEQHFETARQRMEEFGIRIECLNRFRNPAQQKDILRRVADKQVDFLIGTHRLLSQDVHFAKLGLLILDEEQRFGVEHKEKLKTIKKNVDVLTMSATPIPRTLYMAMSGIRDISTITTPPSKRIAQETFVVEENNTLIRDAILRELNRDGQVFFIYNRVHGIDAFCAKMQTLIPEARIAVAHGQMDSDILENTVYSFKQGKYDVLISTTIIENGIDIPNANTLIIYDADKLGLSQLYQLRGRVGRSDRQAYAYLVYRKDKVLSGDAYSRLASILQYNQLGSGFKIAMADLEIRGAGNILGAEQHGNMQKVGYDMYTRLLKEAVAELKGTPAPRSQETAIDCDLPAYAPERYIASAQQRMELYQRISRCVSLDRIDSLRQEICDIYGALPYEVENLLTVLRLRLLSSRAGISNITIRQTSAFIVFASRQNLLRQCVFDSIDVFADCITLHSDTVGIEFTTKESRSDFFAKLDELLNYLALPPHE